MGPESKIEEEKNECGAFPHQDEDQILKEAPAWPRDSVLIDTKINMSAAAAGDDLLSAAWAAGREISVVFRRVS